MLCYDHILNIFSSYASSMYDTGYSYLQVGRYNDSISSFDAALTMVPDNPDIWLSRATAYEAVDEYEKAIQDYDNVLKLDTFNMEALSGKARLATILGDHDSSIEAYNLIITQDPYNSMLVYAGPEL